MTYTGTLIGDMMDIATGKRPIYTKTPRMPIMFYAPPELYDRIKETAAECGTSAAGFCRTAVQAYLEQLEKEQ